MAAAVVSEVVGQWVCVAAFAAFSFGMILLPVHLMRQRRKLAAEADQRVPRCVDCGYDLRGSGHVCPECGRPHSLEQPTPDEVARRLDAMTGPTKQP